MEEQVTTCKYSDWTRGQEEALLNILGEENAKALLAGEVTVEFKPVIKKLFDRNGRRIPVGLKDKVRNAGRDFTLHSPRLVNESDFVHGIVLLHRFLDIYTGTGITACQLKTETERLLAIIKENPQVANIANGVYLPIILPKLVNDDLGTELELYLAGVNKSYTEIIGNREFHNHRKGALAKEVGIAQGSRHEQLIARMKQGPVIGLHFPNPLQGFSVDADREQMLALPQGFVLSGMDTPIAMIMYPGILARDWHTSGLDMAALIHRSGCCSLSFRASDDRLEFGDTGSLVVAAADYSGGLLFID